MDCTDKQYVAPTDQERSTSPGEGGGSVEVGSLLQDPKLLVPDVIDTLLERVLPGVQLQHLLTQA